MTKPSESHKPHDPNKSPRSVLKWFVVGIPLVAAALGIGVTVGGWFGGGGSATPPATPIEYRLVCEEANGKQRSWERDVAQFRVSFETAHDLTEARDAMLLLARQDATATNELLSSLRTLTPPAHEASTQRQLERAWSSNVAELRSYSDRLSGGVTSPQQLVALVTTMPRASLEGRDMDARGLLLRLGKPACSLNVQTPHPIANWPIKLQDELSFARSAEHASTPKKTASDGVGESHAGVTTTETPRPAEDSPKKTIANEPAATGNRGEAVTIRHRHRVRRRHGAGTTNTKQPVSSPQVALPEGIPPSSAPSGEPPPPVTGSPEYPTQPFTSSEAKVRASSSEQRLSP